MNGVCSVELLQTLANSSPVLVRISYETLVQWDQFAVRCGASFGDPIMGRAPGSGIIICATACAASLSTLTTGAVR
jgi:hypothetical protein